MLSNRQTRHQPQSAFSRLSFDEMPSLGLLRMPDVISITGLQRSAIYSQIQKRRFPKPQKLTAHASAWRVGDIRTWLDNPTGWRQPNDTQAS